MTESCLPPLQDNALIPLLFPYAPAAELVVLGTGSVSQREFLADVWALAERLPNCAYAMNLCEDRYHFMVSFCAALINHTINLLPPNRQPSSLDKLLGEYPDCVLLTDSGAAVPSLSHPVPIIALAANGTAARDTDELPELPLIPATRIAALAFTSGSTGTPQANAKPFGTLAALARLLERDLLQHPALTCAPAAPLLIATVPSQHMYGLETTIFMALQTRARLHANKPFFPADIAALLQAQTQPALLIATPTHLRALTQAEVALPPALALLSATAPLDTALARAAETAFAAPLFEIYGCTEAGSMALRQSTQQAQWQLLPGFHFSQDYGTTYAQAPHLPERAPLQDVIELLDARHFLLRGRSADMINVAGKRASLAQLSQTLLDITGVQDAVVFMLEDTHQIDPRPVALVVSERPLRDLLAEFATQVDGAFVPRPLKRVAQLPRNDTGKLTRAALIALWRQLDASPA